MCRLAHSDALRPFQSVPGCQITLLALNAGRPRTERSASLLQQAGYTGKVKIGMDVAASEFFTEDKKYDLDFKTKDEAKKNKADIKTG